MAASSSVTDGAEEMRAEDGNDMRKRLRHRRVPEAAALQAAAGVDDVGEEAAEFGWCRLPAEPLLVVLAFLDNGSVVSAGQTCRGWRAVAKMAAAWRHRKLRYYEGHVNAAAFARVILFAPCLRSVRCRHPMKPYAKKAINTQSQCQVRAVDLIGALAWPVSYMTRMGGHLREVTLTDPNLPALLEAVKLPALQSLRVRVTNYGGSLDGKVPVLPAGTVHTDTVERLVCDIWVPFDAAASLMSLFAASLRDVKLECIFGGSRDFPPVGMGPCVALRRLEAPISVGGCPIRQKRLRDFLQAVQEKPLERLVFNCSSVWHSEDDGCAAFRQALISEGLAKGPIKCKICEDNVELSNFT